ncbi:MAG: cation transporter [Alphaproteobacteria bacterium]|nr:cation transporter [Alphaproteobacteria bacterium]
MSRKAKAKAKTSSDRPALLRRALALEWITVAWMSAEGAIGLWAGVTARSLSVLAFGVDSVIELISAGVLLWRLMVEIKRRESFAEATEHAARRIAGVLLLAVAAAVVVGAAWRLWSRTGQSFTLAGFAVTALAVPLMYVLARAKLSLADALGSRALHADAAESIACGYLAFAVCIGLLAQLALGAWWVDAVTALAIVYFIVQEGREALADEHDHE